MGTRVFSLLQKGISNVWYFVSMLAPYGSPLLIFFHTRTLCSDALVNILPSKHKQDAKIAVDSNLLLNHIPALIAEGSFSRSFTEHTPGFFFFFPLLSGSIYFNCIRIKQNTSSKPREDIFTPFLLTFPAGQRHQWMRAGAAHKWYSSTTRKAAAPRVSHSQLDFISGLWSCPLSPTAVFHSPGACKPFYGPAQPHAATTPKSNPTRQGTRSWLLVQGFAGVHPAHPTNTARGCWSTRHVSSSQAKLAAHGKSCPKHHIQPHSLHQELPSHPPCPKLGTEPLCKTAA